MSTKHPSPWHARQAAMLYKFTSLDYLKQLHAVITQGIDGVADPQAWPLFKDLQAAVAKDIALRAVGKYQMTATDEKLRGAEQFSMQWLTAEEEGGYNQAVKLINKFASNIDRTFSPEPQPRWNDFTFAAGFPEFKLESPTIPKFKIRADIACESGKPPPRTGVYIAADIPEAALQFAVAGSGGFKLKEASTFSEVGKDALAWVGREKLWFDESAMLDFATKSKHASLFTNWLRIAGVLDAELAPPAVSRLSFTTKPARWHFVEEIPDEFELVELP